MPPNAHIKNEINNGPMIKIQSWEWSEITPQKALKQSFKSGAMFSSLHKN